MLQQLERLGIAADGRFATDEELQFVRTYLDSIETRLSAYEKIRDRGGEIVEEWEETKQARPEDLFHLNGRDVTSVTRRDITDVLRLSANTMLFDDLDRLRDGFLIWFQTIAKAFRWQAHARLNYRIAQDVIRHYLTPEEVAMILPAFQLEDMMLGG